MLAPILRPGVGRHGATCLPLGPRSLSGGAATYAWTTGTAAPRPWGQAVDALARDHRLTPLCPGGSTLRP